MKIKSIVFIISITFLAFTVSAKGPKIVGLELPEKVDPGKKHVFAANVYHPEHTIYDISLKVVDKGTETIFWGKETNIRPNNTKEVNVTFKVQDPVSKLPATEKSFKISIYGKDTYGGETKIWDTRNVSIDIKGGPEQVLKLDKGWNMISASKGSFNLSQITDECDLAKFNGKKLWSTGKNGWNHGKTLYTTQGYYIKSERDCIAEIDGLNNLKGNRMLYKGWNMISVTQKAALKEIEGECVFRRYQGKLIWHWRNGEWQNPGKSQKLNPGNGYFVNVESSCKMDFKKPPLPGGN